MDMKLLFAIIAGCLIFLGSVAPGNAQALANPKEGQSQSQQDKDEFECYKGAQQQTGVNPALCMGGMMGQMAEIMRFGQMTPERREQIAKMLEDMSGMMGKIDPGRMGPGRMGPGPMGRGMMNPGKMRQERMEQRAQMMEQMAKMQKQILEMSGEFSKK